MRIFTVVTALLVVLGVASLSAEEAQNVAGKWAGTASRDNYKLEFTMVLAQEGQAVTGTYSGKVVSGGGRRGVAGREVENIPVKGTLAGDKLSLTIGSSRTMETTVAGDSMQGTTAVTNYNAIPMNATRTK